MVRAIVWMDMRTEMLQCSKLSLKVCVTQMVVKQNWRCYHYAGDAMVALTHASSLADMLANASVDAREDAR